MKIHIGSNIIFRVSEQYYTLCNFLIIDFGENLQEYFFVQIQFLIIKNELKNCEILNLFNILSFFKNKEKCQNIKFI